MTSMLGQPMNIKIRTKIAIFDVVQIFPIHMMNFVNTNWILLPLDSKSFINTFVIYKRSAIFD